MTFKSITGIEVNNPAICIAGRGTFACMCPTCMKKHDEARSLFMKKLKEKEPVDNPPTPD